MSEGAEETTQEKLEELEELLPEEEDDVVVPEGPEIDDEEEDEPKKPKKEVPTVNFKISRRALIGWSFVVLLAVAGLVVWKGGYAQAAINHYNQGNVVIKIKDGSNYPIAGAEVTVNGTTYTTDQDGRISIANILAGNYTVQVSKDGYDALRSDISLVRKDNPLQIFALTKQAAKLYGIKGFVQDYVSGQPLVNVQVTLGSQTVATNPNGEYDFSQLSSGDHQLALSKAGYKNKAMTITIATADVVSAKVPLVPSGRVIFTSNRDGYRALYSSSFDGQDQARLFGTKSAGEDFSPVVSPDNKEVVFSSTRDGVKTSDATPLVELYITGSDGTNVQKVSSAVATTITPLWAPNSQRLFFQAYTSADQSQASDSIYTVATGKTFDLGEVANNLVFSSDSNLVAYTVLSSQDQPAPTPTATPDPSVSPAPTPAPATKVSVYVLKTLNLNTGERKILATRPQYIGNVAFTSDNKGVGYTVLQDGNQAAYRDVIATGAETSLPAPTFTNRTYILSPDGNSQIFLETRDGKRDLFLVDKNGGNEKRLTTLGYLVDEIGFPHFDDTGRYITFAVHREGESAIYIVGVSGGDPQKISDYYFDH